MAICINPSRVGKSLKYGPKNIFAVINDNFEEIVLYNIDATSDTENLKVLHSPDGVSTVSSGVSSISFYFIDFHDVSYRDPLTDAGIYA